jgi:hypothetical protein
MDTVLDRLTALETAQKPLVDTTSIVNSIIARCEANGVKLSESSNTSSKKQGPSEQDETKDSAQFVDEGTQMISLMSGDLIWLRTNGKRGREYFFTPHSLHRSINKNVICPTSHR